MNARKLTKTKKQPASAAAKAATEEKTTVSPSRPVLRTGKPRPVLGNKKAKVNAIVQERNQSEQEFRPWPHTSMPARITIETAYAITDAHGRYGQPGFSLGEVTARVETFSRVAEQVLRMANRRTFEQSVRNALKEIHDPPSKNDKRWERELLDLVKKGLIA